MRVNACFALLSLGLVLVQTLPTEKSLKDENLKIEEAGEESDRSKKSILCLESSNLFAQSQGYTNQGAVQTGQGITIQAGAQPFQTLNLQAAAQPFQTLNLQAGAQPIQTLNMQAGAVPVMQTLKVQQQPVQGIAIQPLPTMNLQPSQPSLQLVNAVQAPQPAQIAALQIPPPIQMVNSIQTQQAPQPPVVYPQPVSYNVEIAQQPQQNLPANVNIYQSAPETKPEPIKEVEHVHKEEMVKPEPKPQKVVKVEKEKLMVPMYKEEVMVPKPVVMVSEMQPLTTYLKVPHCHQCQQSVLQCSCRSPSALRSSMVAQPHMHLVRHKEHLMREPMYIRED